MKEVFTKIIDRLIISTEDNILEWTLKKNVKKNYRYTTLSSDGLTTFEIVIDLYEDDTLKDSGMLWINNPSIEPEGKELITSYECGNITKLVAIVFDKYIKSTIVNNDTKSEIVFNSILNTITDKIHNRDEKLSKLLGDDIKEVKEDKKKNWWNF